LTKFEIVIECLIVHFKLKGGAGAMKAFLTLDEMLEGGEKEREKKEEGELASILSLLDSSSEELVTLIENSLLLFHSSAFDELPVRNVAWAKKISSSLSMEGKERLKLILLANNRTDLIWELKARGFSFEGNYAGG
jgi:hypothetical protein